MLQDRNMHDKLRIVRKHEKNKRDGKSDLPELKIKASRSAHASPLYPHRRKAAMGIKGEAKPIYGYQSPIRTFLTQSIEEKQRRIAALGKGKADMPPRHGLCRCLSTESTGLSTPLPLSA